MSEPKEIWLSPTCAKCAPFDERTWCEDPVNDCEDCGAEPVRYVFSPAPVLPTAAAPPAVDEQPKVLGRTFGKDL